VLYLWRIAELNERRSQVLAEFEHLRGSCQELVVMLSDPQAVEDLRSSNLFTMDYLRERYAVCAAATHGCCIMHTPSDRIAHTM